MPAAANPRSARLLTVKAECSDRKRFWAVKNSAAGKSRRDSGFSRIFSGRIKGIGSYNMNQDMDQKNENGEASEQKSGYYINRPSFGSKEKSKLRQHLTREKSLFIVIVLVIIFYFTMLRLDDISKLLWMVVRTIKPIIYGLAIAYLLNPIMKFVEQHLSQFLKKTFPKFEKVHQVSRSVGILAAVMFLVAVIVALCNMMIPELYRSIRDMAVTVPGQLNDALDFITKTLAGDSTLEQIFTRTLREVTDLLQNWMKTDMLTQANVVMTNLTEGVINVVSELFNAIIGIIVSIYVLFSKETFSMQTKKIVYALFRPSQANMILHLTIKSNEIFGGFIIGKIIDSAIIGVLCFVSLSILKMPYTLLVSVIVGVTNVIPFFGPYIGAIPSAILIMLSDPKMGIYFVIFILILQQLDGNIIGPKILGNSTGLSAFWVVFSILLGGGLFGFVGMILGVPTFAVIYYIVRMLINHRLEEKALPMDTNCYDEYSYVDSDGTYVHSNENELRKDEEKKNADQSAK